MATDGIKRKLAVVAAALGAVLLVLRVVGGRGESVVDENAIDRVDTGRSGDEDDGEGDPVETGLERVSTADAAHTVDTDDAAGEVEAGTDVGNPATDDDQGEEVPVVPTDGRFDDLDVFDIVSIVSAGVDAAREEYRNRT